MKNTILLLLLICSFQLATAQQITILGKIVEQGSNTPVEFATIAANDKDTDNILSGNTSDMDGRFELTVPHENVIIEISFLGMATKTINEIEVVNGVSNLGTIELAADGELLDEIVVEGERSKTTFKLDKRVFNVGSDLSSTGASALEVLNNVPSVAVSIEGEVSLRGSTGVQMLINGKPSVLASSEGNALGSITADMIERIEIITNPSAKYDAEGTSGILNIVLKKEEKRGINGSVTINTGIPNNHSIGLSVNRRTEKFNLFSQLGYGYRTFPSESTGRTMNKTTQSTLSTTGENDKNEEFYNVILGADYHIDPLNVLTLSGHFAYEKETEEGFTNYALIDQISTRRDWVRNENTKATNPKWEYELQYKKDFADNKDRNLLFSALGSSFAKDKTSEFDVTGDNAAKQQSKTDFQEVEYTFKLDYTHPVNNYIFETGAQYVIDDVSNDYAVNDFIDNDWVLNQDFTNIFDYNQKVLGTYVTAGYEKDKWGIKGGLRMENTDLSTLLQNTNEKNDISYTDFFPSTHVSYKVTDAFSLQGGYSRRIYRPRLWDLNPFTSFRDNFNLFTGNPNLLPEYTDSYEITSIYHVGQLSLNAGVYYRLTDDVIEDVTSITENISITRPENIGTNNTTGVELNAKLNAAKWLSITTDMNLNSFNRKGSYESTSFDFTGTQWSSRLTSKLKLPQDFDVEISGNYRSKRKTVQGSQRANAFMDLGVRKKILKGRAVVNLSVRDVFASRIRQFTADQPTFLREGESKRGRFVTLGVSFGFGKGEAMEFSGQKRF